MRRYFLYQDSAKEHSVIKKKTEPPADLFWGWMYFSPCPLELLAKSVYSHLVNLSEVYDDRDRKFPKFNKHTGLIFYSNYWSISLIKFYQYFILIHHHIQYPSFFHPQMYRFIVMVLLKKEGTAVNAICPNISWVGIDQLVNDSKILI